MVCFTFLSWFVIKMALPHNYMVIGCWLDQSLASHGPHFSCFEPLLSCSGISFGYVLCQKVYYNMVTHLQLTSPYPPPKIWSYISTQLHSIDSKCVGRHRIRIKQSSIYHYNIMYITHN